MKKGSITNVLLLQGFRLIIAAVIIIIVLKNCSGNEKDVYKANFDSATRALSALSSVKPTVSEIFIFKPGQFGVFFRADSKEVAQIVESCWENTVTQHTTSRKKINPENDCLAYTDKGKKITSIPVIIEKPVQCATGKNCFCVLTPSENKIELLEETDKLVDGNTYTSYYKFRFDSTVCKVINSQPASRTEFVYEKEITYLKQSTRANSDSLEFSTKTGNVNLVNTGGVILTPITDENHQFFFYKGGPENDGFIACKHEEQCTKQIS